MAVINRFYPGSNCGLSNPIKILDRDPTTAEESDGCIVVKKQGSNLQIEEEDF
jgi:hypothetical protein